MPIRDDSAGDYGTWDSSNLSWIDWLKANASDGGNALSNLGRNLVDGFSPIGTSEQGNMALQVPPIVSGIADSYGRLAGTPNKPGNAYNLSGVPELDAPIQQDMSNVLLSLYGGNAVAGLSKRPGAFGGFTAYSPDGRTAAYADVLNHGDALEIANITSFPEFRGQGYAKSIVDDVMREADGSPVRVSPMTDEGRGFFSNNYRVADDGGLSAISDTGKPSILGSAMAGAGDTPLPMDHASRMARAKEMGFDIDRQFYHGSTRDFSEFRPSLSDESLGPGVYITDDPSHANTFAHGFGSDAPGMVYPLVARTQKMFRFDGDNLADTAARMEEVLPGSSEGLRAWGPKYEMAADFADAARAAGFNGIDRVHSEFNPHTGQRQRFNETTVFDPSNMRSVNAAFDPARAGENGLLLSDNRPSLLGSALATGGENYDLPEWLRF